MVKRRNAVNRKLFKIAVNRLVGGVDSPVRSFRHAQVEPVLLKRGSGSTVYDYDGNAYIDYVQEWGASILGHAHPVVTAAVKKAAGHGFGFGATHKSEIEFAGLIQSAARLIERIRFVTSGTEAVMGAIRLARAYTGKNKIVKFDKSYHGHADYLLANAGSGLATLNIPSSPGVPSGFIKETLIASGQDIDGVEDIFKCYGKDIAAIIVEPVGGNNGVVTPEGDFLKELRRITKKFGALLIFDEIITGFRFHFGLAAEIFKVEPDLVCLGKIIGGGLPVGAYGGRAKIMEQLAPVGKVYQASTFSGNPIVMAAGISTLNKLKAGSSGYKQSAELTGLLAEGINNAAQNSFGRNIVTRYRNMFSIRFEDKKIFKHFYRKMLDMGIFFAPSEYEANFVSFAHTEKVIQKTINAAKYALERI